MLSINIIQYLIVWLHCNKDILKWGVTEMCNVTKNKLVFSILNESCSFELSIHQKIM